MKPILLALMLAAAAPLHAQQFCVGTSAELEQRLQLAHGLAILNPSSSVEIRLRRSADPYVIDQDVPSNASNQKYASLSIRGGYSDDPLDACTNEGRIQNASNTVIQYLVSQSQPLEISTNKFLLQSVTFNSTRRLAVERIPNGDGTITIESSIFRGMTGDGLFISADGPSDTPASFRVINSQITGVAGSNGCGLKLMASFSDKPLDAVVANNTIANSGGDGVCVYKLANAQFENNIIWGNAKHGIADLSVGQDPVPTPLFLSHNILQANNFMPGQQGVHVAGISSNPMFVAGSFRLSANSPAINTGLEGIVQGGLPALDLDGNLRIRGSEVDRGAYESLVEDADELVVNTAQDTLDTSNGQLSLRSAIVLANSDPGTERIVFNIANPICEAVIQLDPQLGALPKITESLVIDGYTQGNSQPNTLDAGFNAKICIALRGNGTGVGLWLDDPSVTLRIKGLRIVNFLNGINLYAGEGHVVEGNSFYAEPGEGNSTNVNVADTATNVRIGGGLPAQRNFLASATSESVRLESGQNTVRGNWIAGQSATSTVPRPNAIGVLAWSSNNVIAGNWIFDGTDAGIVIRDGNGNSVVGNEISTNAKGVRVEIDNAASTSSNLIYGNKITDNAGAGIEIDDHTFGNEIWANEIRDNAGLGIDLSPLGTVNANDTDVGFASAARGNASINFPELLQAQHLDGDPNGVATVLGQLNSGNGTYTVRFYVSAECDESGHGESEEAVGSKTLTISNAGQFTNGSVGFSTTVTSSTPIAGRSLTATATSASGNTSEFSACRVVAGTPPPPPHIFGNGFE